MVPNHRHRILGVCVAMLATTRFSMPSMVTTKLLRHCLVFSLNSSAINFRPMRMEAVFVLMGINNMIYAHQIMPENKEADTEKNHRNP